MQIFWNGLKTLKSSENYFCNSISLIARMKAPLPENLTKMEALILAYKYQCQTAVLEIMAEVLFLWKKLLHAEFLEMLANLHSSPIEPRNSDISSGMDDESNNSEMLAATNIHPGQDSWRKLEVEYKELPQVHNGTLQQSISVDAKLIKEDVISLVDKERRQAL